jgi:hypothetical protein
MVSEVVSRWKLLRQSLSYVEPCIAANSYTWRVASASSHVFGLLLGLPICPLQEEVDVVAFVTQVGGNVIKWT